MKASQDAKQAGSQPVSKSISNIAEPLAPTKTPGPAADASAAASQDTFREVKASDEGDQQDELPAAPTDATDSSAASNGEKKENDDCKDDTQVKDNQGKPDVHRTVRALGMGRPGVPSTPPPRSDSVVPDIVVQSSTPGKGEVSEETEKRAADALAAGQHPLAHSW